MEGAMNSGHSLNDSQGSKCFFLFSGKLAVFGFGGYSWQFQCFPKTKFWQFVYFSFFRWGIPYFFIKKKNSVFPELEKHNLISNFLLKKMCPAVQIINQCHKLNSKIPHDVNFFKSLVAGMCSLPMSFFFVILPQFSPFFRIVCRPPISKFFPKKCS